MMRRSAIVLVIIVTLSLDLGIAARISAKGTKPTEGRKVNPWICVNGTLMKEPKKPAVGVKVYVLYKKAGVVVWDKDDKKNIMSPMGKSDSKGRFSIRVPLTFLDKIPQLGFRAPDNPKETYSPGFGLAIVLPEAPDEFKVLVAKDGKNLWFEIKKGTAVLELKDFNCSDAVGPATWAFRYPSGELRVGGELIYDHTQ